MSAWRLLVARLHACGGGPVLGSAFDDESMPRSAVDWGLRDAKRMGLIEAIPHKQRQSTKWRLTPTGWDVAEGRAETVRRSDHRQYIQATWLKALPKPGEIRL